MSTKSDQEKLVYDGNGWEHWVWCSDYIFIFLHGNIKGICAIKKNECMSFGPTMSCTWVRDGARMS